VRGCASVGRDASTQRYTTRGNFHYATRLCYANRDACLSGRSLMRCSVHGPRALLSTENSAWRVDADVSGRAGIFFPLARLSRPSLMKSRDEQRPVSGLEPPCAIRRAFAYSDCKSTRSHSPSDSSKAICFDLIADSAVCITRA